MIIVAHNRYKLVSANIPFTSSTSLSVNPIEVRECMAICMCTRNFIFPMEDGV